jgi:hypothetical protein
MQDMRKPVARRRLLDLTQGVVEYRAIEFLARAIELFQFARDRVGFVLALGQQQT